MEQVSFCSAVWNARFTGLGRAFSVLAKSTRSTIEHPVLNQWESLIPASTHFVLLACLITLSWHLVTFGRNQVLRAFVSVLLSFHLPVAQWHVFFNFFPIKSNVCYLQLYLSKRGAVCRYSSVTGMCGIEKALALNVRLYFLKGVCTFFRCIKWIKMGLMMLRSFCVH